MLSRTEKIERFKATLDHARFEDENFERIFGGFLLPQTIFLGFILAATVGKDSASYHHLLGAASIVGLAFCVPWLTATWRNLLKVNFRLQQAAASEPSGWDLVTRTGKRFSDGAAVWILGRRFRYKWPSRLIPPHVGLRVIVWLFVVAYYCLALAHFDLAPFGWLLGH